MKMESTMFPCGCKIMTCAENAALMELVHCPLLGAAADLLAALEKATLRLRINGMMNIIPELEAAIAKAEREKPQGSDVKVETKR